MTDEKKPDTDDDAETRREDHGTGDQGDPKVPAPFAPDDADDSPLGDTDQHSDA